MITGASSGIGAATARLLAGPDTVLSLAVRDGIIAAEARDERSSGWTWHTQQHNALNTLMPRRVGFAGLPLPWVVARLVKRDATYEDTEPFYNTWLMRTGTAVLDPLPSSASSCDRVSALPAPASFVERASREIMCISPANGDSMLEVKSDSTHSGAAA